MAVPPSAASNYIDGTTLIMHQMSVSNGQKQNTTLASNSVNEPRVYHYCYVCNTQLNSCKQALLHCSGKRHKKKLQFLQARGQAPTQTNPIPLLRNSGTSTTANGQQAPATATVPPPLFPAPPPNGSHVAQCALSTQGQQAQLQPEQQYAPPLPIQYYTEANQQQLQNGVWMPRAPPPFVPAPQQHQAYRADGMYAYCVPSSAGGVIVDASLNSSPLLWSNATDAGSSYSGGLRSAVISPSETSSISSDPSQPSRRLLLTNGTTSPYECAVCRKSFPNGAQLHQHLQQERHYRPHCHRFVNSNNASTSADANLFYCSVCSIAVNGCHAEHAHARARWYKSSNGSVKPVPSRCSSASSELANGNGPKPESGYTSGSGDDRGRASAEQPCQLCNARALDSSQVQNGCHRQRPMQTSIRRRAHNNAKRAQKTTSSEGNKKESQATSTSSSDVECTVIEREENATTPPPTNETPAATT